MSYRELQAENSILKLIYIKFHSQHRSQPWWRKATTLIRHITRLCNEKCRNLERLNFVVHKIIPATARSIHSVLITGSFITVGFALLASVARLNTIARSMLPKPILPRHPKPARGDAPLGAPLGAPQDAVQRAVQRDPGQSIDTNLDEDLGTVIDEDELVTENNIKNKNVDREHLENVQSPKVLDAIDDIFVSDKKSHRSSQKESKRESKKSKKKSKKSKGDAIDDIFG